MSDQSKFWPLNLGDSIEYSATLAGWGYLELDKEEEIRKARNQKNYDDAAGIRREKSEKAICPCYTCLVYRENLLRKNSG